MSRAREPFRLSPGESEFLHRLRAVLALLVVVGHVRSRVWGSYAELADPSLLTKSVFFLTAFGSPSVVLFFVLSGYLITGLYLPKVARGELTIARFLGGRAARLYVVLLPALIVSWGCFQLHGVGTSDGPTFASNLLFLQPTLATWFAGNEPLWSLGFEGVAYVLSGAVAWALSVFRRGSRVAGTAIMFATLGLIAFLGPATAHYLLLWCFGAAAAWLSRLLREPRWSWVFFGSVALTLAAMVRARIGGSWPSRELFVALPGALALATMGASPVTRLKGSKWAPALSGMSYSLYVTHFPLTLVIMRTVHSPESVIGGWANLIGTVAFLVVFAWGFSRWTEAQTPKVRRLLGLS